MLTIMGRHLTALNKTHLSAMHVGVLFMFIDRPHSHIALPYPLVVLWKEMHAEFSGSVVTLNGNFRPRLAVPRYRKPRLCVAPERGVSA